MAPKRQAGTLVHRLLLQAQSWSAPRRIAVKCEYTALGANLRFVVTNRLGTAEEIFACYNQRGQAENFMKEFKADIAADRLSSTAYHANAFRLQLHALAYNLVVLFSQRLLQVIELARATIEQLRVRLFKLGAGVRAAPAGVCGTISPALGPDSLFERVLERLAAIRAP